jgi:hypothetical protein
LPLRALRKVVDADDGSVEILSQVFDGLEGEPRLRIFVAVYFCVDDADDGVDDVIDTPPSRRRAVASKVGKSCAGLNGRVFPSRSRAPRMMKILSLFAPMNVRRGITVLETLSSFVQRYPFLPTSRLAIFRRTRWLTRRNKISFDLPTPGGPASIVKIPRAK